MKDKKIILIIAGIVLLGGIFFITRKSSAPSVNKEAEKITEKVEEANKSLEKKVPDNLKSCTPEILANAGDCVNLPKEDVCGYDHTVYGDGKEKDHGIPYNGACYYCQLFGEDGVMELGETKVTALGYEAGDCR